MSSVKKAISQYGLIVIVSILILVILWWMIFVLFANNGTLKNELKSLERIKSELKTVSNDEEVLSIELGDAKNKLDEFGLIFPPEIDQESTLKTVQSFEQMSGLKVTAMIYEQLQNDTLNQPMDERTMNGRTGTVASNNSVTPPAPGKGMKIPIKTQFESDYAKLKMFVEQIQQSGQRIGIREIQMNTGKDKAIKGTMILEFYGFMPEESDK